MKSPRQRTFSMTKKVILALMIGTVLTSVFLACTSSAKNMVREEVGKTRKMAVVTSLSGQGSDISRKGGLTQSPYAGAFGPLGILIGSAVERNAVQTSLERYSDSLKTGLADHNPKKVLDEAFSRLFIMDFETVNPMEAEKELTALRSKDKSGTNKKGYVLLKDNLGIDSLLEVDFVYGLEVHGRTMSAAVMSADVKLIRAIDGVVLLSKTISSGTISKSWHTLDEFVKNNAELYKSELSKASEAIVYLTGLELGVNLGSMGKFYWQK